MNKKFQQIWKNFHLELEGYINSCVKDEDITKDILQEIFLKIHNNIDGVQDQSKLTSWIYQITRKTIADHFRNLKSQIGITDIDIVETDLEQNENIALQKCIEPFVFQLSDKGLSQIQFS